MNNYFIIIWWWISFNKILQLRQRIRQLIVVSSLHDAQMKLDEVWTIMSKGNVSLILTIATQNHISYFNFSFSLSKFHLNHNNHMRAPPRSETTQKNKKREKNVDCLFIRFDLVTRIVCKGNKDQRVERGRCEVEALTKPWIELHHVEISWTRSNLVSHPVITIHVFCTMQEARWMSFWSFFF